MNQPFAVLLNHDMAVGVAPLSRDESIQMYHYSDVIVSAMAPQIIGV